MSAVLVVTSDSPPPASDRLPFKQLAEAREDVGKCGAWRNAGTRDMHISRAYYKLREMALGLGKPHLVALLCEAPGGFYEAGRETWPAARMHVTSRADRIGFDARVRSAPPPLPHGGDLRYLETIDALVQMWGRGRMDLITADGAAADGDATFLEQENSHLVLAELLAALLLQRESGSLLLKVFEGGTRATLDVVTLLKACYRRVKVTKPASSRATNSELYVVAQGCDQRASAAIAASLRSQWPREPTFIKSACSAEPSDDVRQIFEASARVQCAAIRDRIDQISKKVDVSQKNGAARE